jgi:ribonucleoside-diphosphate reductase alpha chain
VALKPVKEKDVPSWLWRNAPDAKRLDTLPPN